MSAASASDASLAGHRVSQVGMEEGHCGTQQEIDDCSTLTMPAPPLPPGLSLWAWAHTGRWGTQGGGAHRHKERHCHRLHWQHASQGRTQYPTCSTPAGPGGGEESCSSSDERNGGTKGHTGTRGVTSGLCDGPATAASVESTATRRRGELWRCLQCPLHQRNTPAWKARGLKGEDS